MKPRSAPSPHILLVPLLAAGLFYPPAATASPATPAADDAAARFRATVAGALETAPAARRDQSLLAARAAEDRALTGALSPSAEIQREGFDSSLDDEPNAAGYLRFSTSFDFPHQARAGRRLGDASSRWLDAAGRALRVENAVDAGVRWLELAAAGEKVELARGRLQRLERALYLERKRLELGEVAGTDVMQLELERARELSLLRGAEIRREALAAQLRALAGEAFAAPRPGDLERLAELTPLVTSVETPVETSTAEGTLHGTARHGTARRGVASPLLAAAEHEAKLADRRRDLERALAFGRPETEVELERVPDLGPEDGFTAFGFRVAVPLPFGKAGRERRAAADLRAAAAAAEAERQRRAVTSRLEAARRAAQSAAGVLEEFAPTLERLAATEHSLAEQFRLGAISYLVYLDGLARLDGVRLEAVDARRALLEARLEHALLSGRTEAFPLPESLSRATPPGDSP